MDIDPICPICSNRDWENIGTKIYQKNKTSQLSEYTRVRYEVLFEVWFPQKTDVEFTSILCKKCGFAAFKPRPEAVDLVRKYKFLAEHPLSKKEASLNLASDKQRSNELYWLLKQYLKNEPAKILDFGGGNGRLMAAFVDAGQECYVVDHIEQTLPNIQHLCSDVNDIPETCRFDIVICSHVFEHLSHPLDVLKKLTQHLKENSILFIEVPFEIWNKTPLPIEPVTHINFFTPGSMKYLLSLSGLDVLKCEESLFRTEQGGHSFAIRAFAQNRKSTLKYHVINNNNLAETKKFISPSVFLKWKRFSSHPIYRRRILKKITNKYLPETFFWRFFN